jgi:hypothetical protein
MNTSQDPLIDHIISHTISSLDFLQRQGVLTAIPEVDRVKDGLRGLMHRNRDVVAVSKMEELSIAPNETGSSGTVSVVPGLPPRRTLPPQSSTLTVDSKTDRSQLLTRQCLAVALWNYQGDASGDLKFEKGDTVVIDEEGEW